MASCIRIFCFTMLISLVTGTCLAQQKTPSERRIKKIDELISLGRYQKAATAATSLLRKYPRNTMLLSRAADSRWRVRSFEKALVLYGELYTARPDPASLQNYANALLATGHYDMVQSLVTDHITQFGPDSVSNAIATNLSHITVLLSLPQKWQAGLVNINAPGGGGYSPSYLNGGLVFVSSRHAFGVAADGRDRLFFVKDTATIHPVSEDTVLQSRKRTPPEITALLTKANRRVNYGPVTIARDKNEVFFSMNVAYGTNKLHQLALFSAAYQNGRFIGQHPFAHNLPGTSNSHPALSADGNTLFFVSDRPGGYGGNDIYKSVRIDEGTWSIPENLGPKINTSGNEGFPYADADGHLFFASDGWGGLGGLDLFVVDMNDGRPITTPVNLGIPFNSMADDLGIVIAADRKAGYFSSNRSGSRDEIYSFKPAWLPATTTPNDSLDTGMNTYLTARRLMGVGHGLPSGAPVTLTSPQTLSGANPSDQNAGLPASSARFKTGTEHTGVTQEASDRVVGTVDTVTAVGKKADTGTNNKKNGREAAEEMAKQYTENAVKSAAGNSRSYASTAQSEKGSADCNKASGTARRQAAGDGVTPTRKWFSVFFPRNSYNAETDADREEYKRVKAALEADRNLRVVLRTYTDYTGDDGVNSTLAKRRAEAVRRNLKKIGVQLSRVTVVPFKRNVNILAALSDQPYDEGTEAENRRTNMFVVAPGDTLPPEPPAKYGKPKTTAVARSAGSAGSNSRNETFVGVSSLPAAANAVPRQHATAAEPENHVSPADVYLKQLQLAETTYAKTDRSPIRIETSADSVLIELYDNGVADLDTISVIFNGKLMVYQQQLDVRKAIRFYITLDADASKNKMIFYADNLGLIPPNSALMVISDGKQRKEVFVENQTNQRTIVYFIKLEKPKKP